MTKLILPTLFLLLISNACQKCDCLECEQKLKWHERNAIIPIEVPEEAEKPISINPKENQLTVSISKSGVYLIDGDEYDEDQLEEGISKAMDESAYEITSIKIAGNKEVEYQYVFRMMALCQANEWDPILAYDE